MPLGSPGRHVKSLVPSRRTFICPWASISATVAFFVTLGGPAERARAILLCTDSSKSDDVESGAFICAEALRHVRASIRKAIRADCNDRRFRNINISILLSDIV